MLQTRPHHRSSLTADDVVSIRIAAMFRLEVRHIARVTGLPKSTVHNITSQKSHAMVWSETLSPFEDAV